VLYQEMHNLGLGNSHNAGVQSRQRCWAKAMEAILFMSKIEESIEINIKLLKHLETKIFDTALTNGHV
ncbi:hypothetical protein CHS0354_033585, partial [Potamilus streckersoni]